MLHSLFFFKDGDLDVRDGTINGKKIRCEDGRIGQGMKGKRT